MKLEKYLNENIKLKDFNELLGINLNDDQIDSLEMITKNLKSYSKSVDRNMKIKNYDEVLSDIYTLYSNIQNGIKLMKDKG